MKLTLFIGAIVAIVHAYSPQVLELYARQSSDSSSDVLPPSQDPWYTTPDNFTGAAPGSILRIRSAPGNLTSVQMNSSAAYNILYATTDSRYNPTWAVTTLLIPASNISTSNSQLLSYQIPYDSADVDSSPSYAMYGGGLSDVEFALGQGWWVSVPDYEGPNASFTAGVMSGHATIDSVRAVLNSSLGLTETTRYAMWGYSGGALASEWAAELQVQYAPELNFSGAALGGLTPNVSSVMAAVTGTLDAGLIPAGILGLASQYPELMTWLEANLNPSGPYNATAFLAAKNYTLVQGIVAFANQDITKYFTSGVSILQDPIPQYVINRDGIMGYHGVPQMPVFAYKAIHDEVSPIADTDALVERYCGVGATIRYQRNTVGNHGLEYTNGDARAFEFLAAVLNGIYDSTGCQISNVTVGMNNGTTT